MAGKKTRSRVFIVFLFIIAAAAAAVWYYWGNDDYNSLTPVREEDENLLIAKNRINFLIVGKDAEDLDYDNGRSDTLLIVSLDMINKKANLLSIPRDTYVEIPEHGNNKINSAYAYGGLELTMETIENLLHIPIDYYAVTNFSGFEGIVDTLDGVEIDVEKDMYHRTYDGTINIDAGLQTLYGEKALQYVRFRSDALGDISRTERQRKFLLALLNKMTSPETILKLPKLIPQIAQMVETDLSVDQMLQLVKLMKEVDLNAMEAAVLPGDFWDKAGISYWKVNEDDLASIVSQYYSEPVKETETSTDSEEEDLVTE